MNNFTFYSPTLFTFGDGEEKNTGALVRRFGGSRVLLVTGGGSVRRNGAYDAVTASLEAAGIPFTELSDVQANPRSGKVYEGIDLVRRTGADFLLALGGGQIAIAERLAPRHRGAARRYPVRGLRQHLRHGGARQNVPFLPKPAHASRQRE